MPAESWQRVEGLFHAARERSPGERAAFLDANCNGENELRRNVEILLKHDGERPDFIATPAFADAPELLINEPEALLGHRLGPFHIDSVLGVGGMGVVYLATDDRLGRKVGLKLLPRSLVADKGQLERLKHEARTASALNHPNIVTIHEIGEADGTHYIATEFIEGTTLRERLANGPIPPDEALDIAQQIAGALSVAHAAGIVHRDIKPENIMLRPDGYVKVLDFGIAKLNERQPAAGDVGTTAVLQTRPGLLVGTARYMSPEQARGQAVDACSDIWSLGVVLYEMAGGSPPFTDDTPSDCIASILKSEPPSLSDVLPEVQPKLQSIVQKALRKNRDERYQTISEMLADLRNLKAEVETHNLAPQTVGKIKQHKRVALLTLAAAILVAAVLAYSFSRRAPARLRDSRALFQEARILAAHSSSHLEGRQNNPRVIQLLEKAVAADPGFAEAHAELALAYVIRLFLYAPEEKQLEQKAYLEVERALSLNPNLPSAYLARGRLKWTPFHHFPHEDAINDFKRALALDPNLDEAHHYLGLVLLHIGLLEEARAAFQTAIALNPSNNGAQFRLGETLFFEQRYREARNVFEKIDADFNPALKEYQLDWTLFALGQTNEAISRLENYLKQHPEDGGGLLASVQAMMLAALGSNDEAEKRIQAAQTRRGFGHFHHTEYNIACAYALMNKTDLAIEWFERAVNDGFNCYPMFKNDSNLDSLRNDARFQRIMEAERIKWENYRAKFAAQAPLPEKRSSLGEQS